MKAQERFEEEAEVLILPTEQGQPKLELLFRGWQRFIWEPGRRMKVTYTIQHGVGGDRLKVLRLEPIEPEK